MLASGDLSILFEDIFNCESVRQVLQKKADDNTYLKLDIVSLLNNKWNTSVDFRDAMQNLFAVKDKLEGSYQRGTERDIQAGKATTVILSGSAFGSEALTSQSDTCMNHSEPCAGFESWAEQSSRSWNNSIETSSNLPFSHNLPTRTASLDGDILTYAPLSRHNLVFHHSVPEKFPLPMSADSLKTISATSSNKERASWLVHGEQVSGTLVYHLQSHQSKNDLPVPSAKAAILHQATWTIKDWLETDVVDTVSIPDMYNARTAQAVTNIPPVSPQLQRKSSIPSVAISFSIQ